MAEPSMHFGIIGCANIARKVARAINLAPNSVLHAIASRSIEKAKQFAIQNGFSDCVKIYGSYTEILDDPIVDVVYIPLPTTLHVQWAVMAAQKKKHLLLEKPTALDVEELDKILEACESNGVQFMDGSMWLHHPRTTKMKEFITDSQLLGQLNFIHSSSTISSSSEFIENDIRVKPDMDSLGALGDLGWYCIGAILWAKDYQIPTSVTALPGIVKNSAGVILSFTASFHYNQADKTTFATIDCSFLSHTSMDLAISGSNGSLYLHDYIIPFQETSASFEFTLGARFAELRIGWNMKPEKVEVVNELPQEALMVQGLSRIVQNIKNSRGHPEDKWPEISRKTQLVLDAVKRSIDLGCKTVHL